MDFVWIQIWEMGFLCRRIVSCMDSGVKLVSATVKLILTSIAQLLLGKVNWRLKPQSTEFDARR